MQAAPPCAEPADSPAAAPAVAPMAVPEAAPAAAAADAPAAAPADAPAPAPAGSLTSKTKKQVPLAEKVKDLKNRLAGHLTRMMDLFRKWDSDDSGTVDQNEFRLAVQAMVPKAEDAVILALFKEYDSDSSGDVSYKEYVKFSVRDGLSRQKERVSSLLKLWDVNCNGTIDKDEFVHAIEHLGFKAPREELHRLFDELDEDGSGELDYTEINRWLRNGTTGTAPVECVAGDRRGGAEASKRARAKRYLTIRERDGQPRRFPPGWRPAPRFIKGVSVVLPSSSRPPSPPPEEEPEEPQFRAILSKDACEGEWASAVGAIAAASPTPEDAQEDASKLPMRLANLDLQPNEPAAPGPAIRHANTSVPVPVVAGESIQQAAAPDTAHAEGPPKQPTQAALGLSLGPWEHRGRPWEHRGRPWEHRGWQPTATWTAPMPARTRFQGGPRVGLCASSERPATAPERKRSLPHGGHPSSLRRYRAPPMRSGGSSCLARPHSAIAFQQMWSGSSSITLEVVGSSTFCSPSPTTSLLQQEPRLSQSPSRLLSSRTLRAAHLRARSASTAAARERDLQWWRSAIASDQGWRQLVASSSEPEIMPKAEPPSVKADPPSVKHHMLKPSPSAPHFAGPCSRPPAAAPAASHRSAPILLNLALENANRGPRRSLTELVERASPSRYAPSLEAVEQVHSLPWLGLAETSSSEPAGSRPNAA